MKKVILKPSDVSKKKVNKKERITIQLRAYDSDGVYDKNIKDSNATIHFKQATIDEVYEILKSSLLNSRLVSSDFSVE